MRGTGHPAWSALLFAASFSGAGRRGRRPRAREAPFPRIHGAVQPYDPVQARPVRAGLPGGPRLSPARLGHRRRHELHPAFPSARNGVDWGKVYGDWKAAGYETDVSIMFDNIPAKSWKDLPGTPAPTAGRSRRRSARPRHRIWSPPPRSATSRESTTTKPTAPSSRTWPAACARATRS